MSQPGALRYALLMDVNTTDGDIVPLFWSTFLNDKTVPNLRQLAACETVNGAMLFHTMWAAAFFREHWLTHDNTPQFYVATVRLNSV